MAFNSYFLILLAVATCLADATEKPENSVVETSTAVSTPLKTTFVILGLAALSGSILAVLSIFFYPSMAKNFEEMMGTIERTNRLQKRSLEYLGPILQTLAQAYEMYDDNDGTKKNFPKLPFYER